MPQKSWVVGEQVLAADFNTYVQTQVVAQFATVAARDAWSSPPNGSMCVTLDTGSVWQRIAGAWYPGPGGEFGYAEITADISVSTTSAAGGIQVANPGNITYPGGVPVIIEFFVANSEVPTGCQLLYNLFDAATDMSIWGQIIPGTVALSAPTHLRRRLVPSAGSHNYHVRTWKGGSSNPIVHAATGTWTPTFCRITRA
jgi:hypothetical protein